VVRGNREEGSGEEGGKDVGRGGCGVGRQEYKGGEGGVVPNLHA